MGVPLLVTPNRLTTAKCRSDSGERVPESERTPGNVRADRRHQQKKSWRLADDARRRAAGRAGGGWQSSRATRLGV